MEKSIGVFFTDLVVAVRVERVAYLIKSDYSSIPEQFRCSSENSSTLVSMMLNDLLAYMSSEHTNYSLEVVLGLLQ